VKHTQAKHQQPAYTRHKCQHTRPTEFPCMWNRSRRSSRAHSRMTVFHSTLHYSWPAQTSAIPRITIPYIVCPMYQSSTRHHTTWLIPSPYIVHLHNIMLSVAICVCCQLRPARGKCTTKICTRVGFIRAHALDFVTNSTPSYSSVLSICTDGRV
jgi:hypothetical protein